MLFTEEQLGMWNFFVLVFTTYFPVDAVFVLAVTAVFVLVVNAGTDGAAGSTDVP